MNDKRIDGLTIEEILVKFEPMVHKIVNSAKTNAVCNTEDMVQEGRIAIIKAFHDYDVDRKNAFSTVAHRYITTAIVDYQKKHLSVLSGGSYLQEMIKKAGPDATKEDLLAMGLRQNTVHAASYIKDSFTTVEYDALYNTPVIEDDFIDRLALEFFNWRQYLDEREIFVVENHFGFNGEALPSTVIGRSLGVHRKTVINILNRALNKIRHAPDISDYAFD